MRRILPVATATVLMLALECALARPVDESGASVEADGIRIHYRETGDGPPLLLLHGFTGTNTWWNSYLARLAEHYRTIVPDLPGHGRSGDGPDPYRFDKVATDLHALMDELDVDRFRAIGFSGGGIVLLHMATQQPARIESMVVISAPHVHEGEAILEFPSFENQPPQVRELWLKIHPGGETQVRRLIASFHALSESVEEIDVRPDELARIRARTLVVLGDRDPWFPVALATKMVQGIPAAALWVIPMAGHFALWPDWGGSAEAASIFPEVAKRFLGSGRLEASDENR